jgi:hypothetical protein
VKIVLALIAVAYTVLFLSLSSDPFTDAPNHLARAAIMNSLWFDPHSPFHQTFAVSHVFMPYMLPDLGLILVIRVLGFDLACPVWSTLTMLVLVFAVWFYARQMLSATWAITAALLCSWYVATNYFFILGFFSFQWGIAASLIALGALESWRRNNSTAWIALYFIASFLVYGAHLACFAILAATIGVVGFIRTLRKHQTWIRFAAELLPFALLTVYQLLRVPSHLGAVGEILTHNTVKDKFGHFVEAMFVRQNYVVDRTVLSLFWGMIIAAIWFGIHKMVSPSRHWELAATCVLAALIYFVLPFGLGGIFYVDERALPFFFIPLLMLSLRVMEDSSPAPNHIALLLLACVLLAAANLGSLALFLPRQNHEVAKFREALQTIPPGKIVLPIFTRRRDGSTYPLRHAASFYAVDRNGYVPYLFSQANASGPSGYFEDLAPIYRPPQSWYMSRVEPDWKKVAQTYDYVVITKPWNRARIDRTHLDLTYENPIATVFRVRR